MGTKADTEAGDLWGANPMRRPKVRAVTLNISVGRGGEILQRAGMVLEELTGQKPVVKRAKRTIRDFGIRKGDSIAVAVTVRGKKAEDLLDRLLDAIGRKVKASSFDRQGNFAFGIKEHIDIPGMRYRAEIGIFGMDVAVTMGRPGYRIVERRLKRRKIPQRHRLSRDESIFYAQKYLNIEVE